MASTIVKSPYTRHCASPFTLLARQQIFRTSIRYTRHFHPNPSTQADKPKVRRKPRTRPHFRGERSPIDDQKELARTFRWPQSPTTQRHMSARDRVNRLTISGVNQDPGILPGTFIPSTHPFKILRPFRNAKLKEWRTWYRGFYDIGFYYYTRFISLPFTHWNTARNNLPAVYDKLDIAAHDRKPHKTDKQGILHEALELHKDMYEAFADGDKAAIRSICLPGLATSFLAHLQRRQESHKENQVVWKRALPGLEQAAGFLGFLRIRPNPYLVSFVIQEFPEDKATGQPQIVCQQAVVSIRSWQVIYQGLMEGKPELEESSWRLKIGPTLKSEYLVMQRKFVKGDKEEWRAWGFAKETTLDNIKDITHGAVYDKVMGKNAGKKGGGKNGDGESGKGGKNKSGGIDLIPAPDVVPTS
ncbi:hypothetical protein BT63DRAFT_409125 [Microthyrium microscopicum]|uniref:Tim44-like domain-containing protein n=1 Tax=Microthyrium microscopicum TaxID=703497 RepID=A0A6A6URY3_9PEZI|nr:hypothetical protein BT63DRAFT_409125 [Microthyrium microscopicum]